MSSFISDIESLHTQMATAAYMMRINLNQYKETEVLRYKEQYQHHRNNYIRLFKQLMVPVIDHLLDEEQPVPKPSNFFINLLNVWS